MQAVGAVEVEVPEPLHRGGGEAVPLPELAVGGGVAARVGDRVDQRLHAQRDLAAQPARDDRGEVAAGAVARDRQPLGVGAERGRVGGEPADRAGRVLEPGRERRLGREPVVDADDDRARRVGERAHDGVEGVDRAEHPAAAVQVDDERQRAVALRAGTGAPGSSPRGRLDLEVAHLRDRLARSGHLLRLGLVAGARLVDRHLVRRRPGEREHPLEDLRDLRVELGGAQKPRRSRLRIAAGSRPLR